MYSWSQQRDQYVVDAPWIPEGLKEEGQQGNPATSMIHVESWQVGQVGPGLASHPQWKISCIQSG